MAKAKKENEIVVFFRANDAGDIIAHGATADYEEQIRALPRDREGKMVVTFPRNLLYHKKFFAMLKAAFDYMLEEDRIRHNVLSVEQLLIRLKLDLGMYTLYVSAGAGAIPEGQPIYIPDSISFGSMDDVVFGTFYKAVVGVLVQKYVSNQTEESMMQVVDNLLRFA